HAGRRPGIILGSRLSCDIPNNLVLIVPCTRTDRRLPWQPRIALGDQPGVAMCDQLKSIDVARLTTQHPCGEVSDPSHRAAIARAVRELLADPG
ncbi:MAG: type II toxin-antitoxin system PemK/MazF family toxin, partial [Angustibacter sp.]